MSDSLDQWTVVDDPGSFEIDAQAPDQDGAAVGSQALYYNGSSAEQVLTADASSSHSNMRLEYACIADSTANSHGLAFGYQDSDNYYFAEMRSTSSDLAARLDVRRIEDGSAILLHSDDSLGSVSGDPEHAWFDCRIEVWDSPDGQTIRAWAGDRDPQDPFDDDALEPVSGFTITDDDFIGGSWTPDQVGLSFGHISTDPLWRDDIRLYWD